MSLIFDDVQHKAITEMMRLSGELIRVNGVNTELLAALRAAVRIAEEARREWDAAPNGMRAGKLLIALGGGCKGYRADIDAIHAAIAKAEGRPE